MREIKKKEMRLRFVFKKRSGLLHKNTHAHAQPPTPPLNNLNGPSGSSSASALAIWRALLGRALGPRDLVLSEGGKLGITFSRLLLLLLLLLLLRRRRWCGRRRGTTCGSVRFKLN